MKGSSSVHTPDFYTSTYIYLDREDHHFCGIIFPVKCKNVLPIEHIIINSVAVRGELGPITVWVSNVIENDRPANGRYRFRLSQKHWTQVYEHTHEPSPRVYKSMVFSEPIILLPGQVRLMYIHSKAQGDQAIVYDNSSDPHPAPRHEDSMMAIFSGKAHLSPVPFGQTPICKNTSRAGSEIDCVYNTYYMTSSLAHLFSLRHI